MIRGQVAVVLLAVVGLAAAQPSLAAAPDPALAAAEALYRQDGPEVALPRFQQLAERFRASGDEAQEATALHFVGECHWRLGRFDEARPYLDRALEMRSELGDLLGQGKTLNVLGLLAWDSGDYDRAIDLFENASAIARAIGDKKLEGATLNNTSLVYDELGHYKTSLTQYERVLELYRGAGFPRGEGDTYSNIGGVHLLLGQYRKAIEYFEKSMAISRHLDSRLTIGIDHGNMALAYLGLGQVDTAIGHFDTAIELAVETGLEYDAAIWHRGRGNALIRKGHYDAGLDEHRLALAAYENIGAQAELISGMHDLGQLYLTLGDTRSAEQYFRKAIALATDIELARGVTFNLVALGDLYLRRQQYDDAASHFEKAGHRATRAGEQSALVDSLLGLSRVQSAQERLDAASDNADQALSVAREIDARHQEAEALYLLADNARQTSKYDEALETFAAATSVLGESGDPDLLWQIHFGRARTFESLGDRQAAIESLQQAVRVIESVRSRLREDRFRAGYLQDRHQVYVELVRLQLELDRIEEAFNTAERLRARSYAEQFDQTADVTLSDAGRQRETELRERVRQLQRAMDEELTLRDRRQAALKTFSVELLAAEREYQDFLDDQFSASSDRRGSPMLSGSAEIREQLDDDELMLEYIVGESELMIFALSRSDLYATIEPVRKLDLHSRVELLRDLLNRPGDERWIKPAQSLTETVIAPIARAGIFDGVAHIYLVPHGILNYLPYAVLPGADPDAERLLVEDFTLSYLPAAALIGPEDARHEGPTTLLAVAPGQSRLRYAPDEARSVNALFEPNSRLLLGDAATEGQFKKLAGDFRMLHLATHSEFNKVNPMFSGLLLEPDDGNDGRLEVHEVLRLRLDADLVTLSACDTALGSGYFAAVPAGDEFVGLTRAFLAIGSDAVMATLWEVDDRSSVELMTQFYKILDESGATAEKSAALARAQKHLRATEGYEHPYFWAPFVLVEKMHRTTRARKDTLEARL